MQSVPSHVPKTKKGNVRECVLVDVSSGVVSRNLTMLLGILFVLPLNVVRIAKGSVLRRSMASAPFGVASRNLMPFQQANAKRIMKGSVLRRSMANVSNGTV